MKKHNGMRSQDIVFLLKILALGHDTWYFRNIVVSLKLNIFAEYTKMCAARYTNRRATGYTNVCTTDYTNERTKLWQHRQKN